MRKSTERRIRTGGGGFAIKMDLYILIILFENKVVFNGVVKIKKIVRGVSKCL